MLDKTAFHPAAAALYRSVAGQGTRDKGIGRPSTYAQIIDTLKRRKLCKRRREAFFPTEVGLMVKDILVRQFADVFDIGFTATMEIRLIK